MKSELALAITQLAAEKRLPKEVILAAIETALISAYRKEGTSADQNIAVKLNPNTFEVKVFTLQTVAEPVTDDLMLISLADARKIKSDAQVGEIIEIETTPKNAGRIAAQTAKQVIMQRLHEAEHAAIYEELVSKEGDIVSGVVRRIEPGKVFIDMGRIEAVLPATEQIRGERYRVGQRIKVYLAQILRVGKLTEITVSRAHRNLVRRLFEMSIPEIQNGIVEVKSIAREAGFRTKVAVAAKQPGIDPVGTCVGQRGIRIQNIVTELGGEKIDVIQWSADSSVYIANALSPAQILSVTLNEAAGVATVVVPDKQLSLAIGKEGQNARLAAKLTGWRIDIKSATMAEAEAKETEKVEAETKKEAIEEAEAIAAARADEAPATEEVMVAGPLAAKVGVEEAMTGEGELAQKAEAVPEPTLEAVIPEIFIPIKKEEPREIRFAEDLFPSMARSDKKAKTSKEDEAAKGKTKKSKRVKAYEEPEEDAY